MADRLRYLLQLTAEEGMATQRQEQEQQREREAEQRAALRGELQTKPRRLTVRRAEEFDF